MLFENSFFENMKTFPSPNERIAASALLLLSAISDDDSQFCFDIDEDDDEVSMKVAKSKRSNSSSSTKESLISSDSKSMSCSSSLTIDDGSSEQIKQHRLKIIDVVARAHAMKFEVVRKSRSKHYRSSDRREFTPGKPTPIMSSGSVSESTTTTEASSCLSSSSSAIASARSRYVTGVRRDESMKRKHVGSAYIRHRAEAILRLLSGGCASEMKIRQVLGDSPDTSKALRMLLKLEEINRTGAGGRSDPFIYMIAGE